MATFLALAKYLFLLISPVFAGLANRTIDDFHGDSVSGVTPLYGGSWNYGPQCPRCGAQPEKAGTFMSSWHDSTTTKKEPYRNVQFSFNGTHCYDYVRVAMKPRKTSSGTAIWVYCVVPNHISKITTLVNISFELDGEHAGYYTHKPDENSEKYSYNVTVYNNTRLSKTQHTLNMLTTRQGSQDSLLLFDWAEYTP